MTCTAVRLPCAPGTIGLLIGGAAGYYTRMTVWPDFAERFAFASALGVGTRSALLCPSCHAPSLAQLGSVGVVDDIIHSPNDPRQYKALRLANGLEVLCAQAQRPSSAPHRTRS
jgi:hypothetical protein